MSLCQWAGFAEVNLTSANDWSAKEATDEIRKIARSKHLSLSYKIHARERLSERSLILSDVLFVLKYGFVYDNPIPSTRLGFNRYKMVSQSPNSGNRSIGVVVIPDKKSCTLKIITVMWVDEKETRSGTIVGDENE
jgi:Domain of unknown function (DUF4258)